MIHALLQVTVIFLCLAGLNWTLLDRIRVARAPHVERGGRTIRFVHLATALGVGLLGLVVVGGVARSIMSLPPPGPTVLDRVALGSATGAVVALLWDPASRFPLAALYALGLVALGMMDMARGLSPGKFYLWASFPEWVAFVMIAALIGWTLPKLTRMPVLLRIPNTPGRFVTGWFNPAQAFVAISAAAVTAWVSFDSSFNGMGEGLTVVVLTGRWAACPTALMLLGGTILMAWQTHGAWRATWQFSAMVAAVLLTSSAGWASLDAESPAFLGRELSLRRSITFMISTGMMTFMTGVGLPRTLPPTSDWITRARQAMPVFGCLFLLMMIAVLIQKV